MIALHLFQCKLVVLEQNQKELFTCQMVVQVNTRTATTSQICAIMRKILEFQLSGISLLLLMAMAWQGLCKGLQQKRDFNFRMNTKS